MNQHAVYHRPRGNYAYFATEDTVTVVVRTARDDAAKVEVSYFDKYAIAQTLAHTPMALLVSDGLFSYYTATLCPPYKRLAYYFCLTGAEGQTLFYDEMGFHSSDDQCEGNAFQMPYINGSDVICVPQWAKRAVFYQIFPDSFARAAHAEDTAFDEGLPAWGSEPHIINHMGGNLRGIIENFGHIKALGANALYLCPVFASNSCHRYNTADYKTIDPRLGTMEDFTELLGLCRQNGVRVLLDAVFNHTCDIFPAFLDVIEKGESSKYKDWYFIRSWPVKVDEEYRYDRFAFEPHMPKLNTANPEVAKYLLDIVRFWTETGIDGWRLDVANEIDLDFWRSFRKTVKAVNPQALILGEMWNDSLPYLGGDMVDSVMNYPFATACQAYFLTGKVDAEGFKNLISQRLVAYPMPMVQAMYNLLGSHDTPRWLTLAGGDVQRVALSYVFQFTFVGMPAIYYGDETGMEGDDFIKARRCMDFAPGAAAGQRLFDLCKGLVRLRTQSAALCEGDFAWLPGEPGLVAFARKAPGEELRVYLNGSGHPAPINTLPKGACLVFTSAPGSQTPDEIEPMGYRIFQCPEPPAKQETEPKTNTLQEAKS